MIDIFHNIKFDGLLPAFYVFAKTFGIYAMLKYLISPMFRDIVKKTSFKWDDHLFPLLEKVMYLFVWLAGLCTVLTHYSVNLSGIWATIGGMSLVIGLAVKDAISNLITGAMIIAYRPFLIDHEIEYSGDRVRVLDIGYHHCKFFDAKDKAVIIVRNQDLFKKAIKNYTLAEEIKQNENIKE
jgi:small-conductance mechanosensitive channel